MSSASTLRWETWIGAFDALERALVSGPQRIALFLMWPEMAAVRADARYASVRRRLKLP